MALPCYLAMTAAEMAGSQTIPSHPAWMACHFSPYGTGLSNFPRELPAGAMIILNDRTPVQGHDPALIAEQLSAMAEDLAASAVLLDFQREENTQTAAIAKSIIEKLPCPVGVTEYYGTELSCALFLPPPPLYMTLSQYLAPWAGRELWLEIALDSQVITLTPEGCRASSPFPALPAEPYHTDAGLHCRYHTEISPARAAFTLFRTPEDLDGLLPEAEDLGVTRAVGLYQELKTHKALL